MEVWYWLSRLWILLHRLLSLLLCSSLYPFSFSAPFCSIFASAHSHSSSSAVHLEPPHTSSLHAATQHNLLSTAGSNSGIKIEEKQTECGNARFQHTDMLDVRNKGRIGYRCVDRCGRDGFNAGSADEHCKAFSLCCADLGGVGLLLCLAWPLGLGAGFVFFGVRAPRRRSSTSGRLRHLSPSSSGS